MRNVCNLYFCKLVTFTKKTIDRARKIYISSTFIISRFCILLEVTSIIHESGSGQGERRETPEISDA